jgi:transketolase
MRTAFIEALVGLADEDERVWLLSADLGYSVLEQFADRFPGRFVNVGVAEQNMTGIAAGLAMSGKIVFTYSIANFPVMRCLEQVRNDVCYHNLPVKIVAVGGGVAYASAGYSHHGVEDIAVMRVLPNMTVVSPGDPVEARLVTRAVASHPGPCYVRLGKAGEPVIHRDVPDFALGRALRVRSGDRGVIFATGTMLHASVAAADLLATRGVPVSVFSMPTVQPLDSDVVLEAAHRYPRIVTVEEHGVGGLGSAVAEALALRNVQVPLTALRLPSQPFVTGGSQDVIRREAGLDVKDIAGCFSH